MAPTPSPQSNRRPPVPSDSSAEVDAWVRGVMPGLQPLVSRLDVLIRAALPQPQQYAVKWKKAYYGLPGTGWVIELVAYDVSVNVVFLGGADFASPPPLGSVGRTRYVKLRTAEEAEDPELRGWIKQSAEVPGWR